MKNLEIFKQNILNVFLFINIFLFIGCGGGGGSSTIGTETPVSSSADFIDAPVKGITYSCSESSRSGITNENGTFDYDDSCGIITFSIGGVTLYSKDTSSIPADKKLYITDLVGVNRTDTNNSKVLALSRFVQSLDDNNNPYDGINITNDVKVALANSIIDFTTNPSITDLNNTITNLGKTLVSEDDAKAHFTYTLNSDFSLEIDGPPPPAPFLTITPTIINQNSITVEINGQPESKIFLNGIDQNITIPLTSKINLVLPLSGPDGNYDFNITLEDNAKQMSNPKLFTINKDTITPVILTSNDINISENNTIIVNIDASDTTISPYQNLVYSISEDDGNSFEINSSTGVLTYKGTLDFEHPSDKNYDNNYSIIISVTDGINITTQNFYIKVTDLADTVPILSSFSGSVNENALTGTHVGKLTIQSNGDSAIINITLADLNSSTISSAFISDTTGQITVKSGANLDYETKNIYYLKAIATNNSGLSNEVNVTISLNNLTNEIKPILDHFNGSIDENATAGTIIGTINLSNTLDSNISSFTLSGTGAENFDINSSGTITLLANNILDYESTSKYDLTVTATNSAGISDSKNVTISINNIPEIAPILADTNLSVYQNAPEGRILGLIGLISSGDSSITSYNLLGNGANNFNISPSGVVTVASGASLTNLDVFTLDVNATNFGGISNTIKVTITVKDLPTALPVLHSISLDVKEGTPQDKIVGQLFIDAGDTAIEEINITSELSTHENAFTISPDGKIRVSGTVKLDFETRPFYQFNVKAFNVLGASNEITATINITYVSNLYILSAVYDNNKTNLDSNNVPIVNDDTLYLFFSKSVDESAFSANRKEDFTISGGGSIGSGSITSYSDNPYHLYIIKGDYATGSLAFTPGLTKIAISNNQLTDSNGSYPSDYNTTTVEAFKHIIATGQTSSYDNTGTLISDSSIKDDGYYQKGLIKSFSRDSNNNIVFDNTNGLIWEDTSHTLSIQGSWDVANSYCQELTLGSYTNWRLPTIQEWLSIIDRSKYQPVIDNNYFTQNVDNQSYWSNSIDASNSSKMWRINVQYGSIHTTLKNDATEYTRCVHDK